MSVEPTRRFRIADEELCQLATSDIPVFAHSFGRWQAGRARRFIPDLKMVTVATEKPKRHLVRNSIRRHAFDRTRRDRASALSAKPMKCDHRASGPRLKHFAWGQSHKCRFASAGFEVFDRFNREAGQQVAERFFVSRKTTSSVGKPRMSQLMKRRLKAIHGWNTWADSNLPRLLIKLCASPLAARFADGFRCNAELIPISTEDAESHVSLREKGWASVPQTCDPCTLTNTVQKSNSNLTDNSSSAIKRRPGRA